MASSPAIPSTSHSVSCALLAAGRRGHAARLLVLGRARCRRHSRRRRASGRRAGAARRWRASARGSLGTRKAPVLFAPEMARGLFGALRRRGARRQPVPQVLVPAGRRRRAGASRLPADAGAAAPAAARWPAAPFDAEGVATRDRELVQRRRAAGLCARQLLGAQARAARPPATPAASTTCWCSAAPAQRELPRSCCAAWARACTSPSSWARASMA